MTPHYFYDKLNLMETKMKKSVNLYFDSLTETKTKILAIKQLGYDEFYTGIFDKNETLNLTEQVNFAKKLGLECTMIHSSYKDFSLNNFWLDNSLGDEILNSYIKQLELCKNLTKNFVVHLNDSTNSIVSIVGLERIKKLLKICEKQDINLCIENLYSEKEIPYIFEHIKHKNLKICFDCGHQNFLTLKFDVMKNYHNFVSVLHLHDNDAKSDQHNVCGTGSINLKKLAKDLSRSQNLTLSAEIRTYGKNYYDVLKENFNALEKLNKLINDFI